MTSVTPQSSSFFVRWGSLLCLGLIYCFISISSYAQESITVAVASSLYSDMQQQVKIFEKSHDASIRLVAGSTGRLYNQIQQGAPFDAFIAADAIHPALLLKQGKAISEYAVGNGYLGLMLGKELVGDLSGLMQPNIKHIAIANPDVAPFGLAAKKSLEEQKVWETLKPKFVYAQNALQSAMMVQKGLVDAGFIPVRENQAVIAVITYHGVLLTNNSLAKSWLKSISPQNMVLQRP